MRRTLKTLSPCLVAFLLMLTVAFAGNAQELQKKLEGLKGISGIEKLESDHYAEKYLVRITQPVDHKDPAAGTFTQRVIVAHVGFDRPTILVTEGYGAAYALNPRYQEELSKLLDANMVFVEYRYFLESTPTPCNWKYLTAENSAYDLHNVNQTFRELYTEHRHQQRRTNHLPVPCLVSGRRRLLRPLRSPLEPRCGRRAPRTVPPQSRHEERPPEDRSFPD